MKSAIQLKTVIPSFFVGLMLLCLATGPKAQAVSPPPDGGYVGGNTAEGQTALFSLTSGGYNTAVGFFSLRSNTIGSFNTATGAGALFLNASENPNTAKENTATGAVALLSNTNGFQNTADGAFALSSNTTGSYNTIYSAQRLQPYRGGQAVPLASSTGSVSFPFARSVPKDLPALSSDPKRSTQSS